MVAVVGEVRSGRLGPGRAEELYRAVVDLLTEQGYGALTMDAVASRVHMSKATLYRQWGGKDGLVASALKHFVTPIAQDIPDTGSLRGDLDAFVDGFDDAETARRAGLVRGIGQAAHEDAELEAALRELIVEPCLRYFTPMLRRAMARGELAPENAAVDFIVHMVLGGVLAPEIMEGSMVTQAGLRRYVHAVVLPALGAA